MGLIHTFASAPKRGCDMSSWLLSLFLACSLATATLAKESFKLENEKNFEGKEKRTINYEIPTRFQRNPYEFGVGKRSPYEFGIGKRSPYEFGVGKRSPFGNPKRSWDFDWGQYSKRKPYNFGVGKR